MLYPFLLYLLKKMESTFNCIGIKQQSGFYFAEFEKTENSDNEVTEIKGQLIIGQKTLTIKLNKEEKDFYKQGSTYVFDLFNNTALKK